MTFIRTSIADCLNFVDVIIVNDVIECGVELVEEVHDLVGGAGTRQLCKANDITAAEEKHSHPSLTWTLWPRSEQQKSCIGDKMINLPYTTHT